MRCLICIKKIPRQGDNQDCFGPLRRARLCPAPACAGSAGVSGKSQGENYAPVLSQVTIYTIYCSPFYIIPHISRCMRIAGGGLRKAHFMCTCILAHEIT